MKLLSINVGLPRDVEFQGQTVSTGIFKSPLEPSLKVSVNKINIEGDKQADLRVHGGVDKAVYGYGADSFTWWEKTLGRPIEPGEMGENLTFETLREDKIFIGNSYELGSVVLQVVQPRMPCFKLGIRFNDMGILKTFNTSRRPGIYFRVLKEGQIQVGDTLKLSAEDPQKVPLQTLFDFKLRKDSIPRETLERALKIKNLNETWKHNISKFLQA